ncbi:dihydrofolate reductase [Alphaproteobacteria bacterium]|nr:dihydrofolate reductase [Alphaproteobacteria bacterium]
MILAVAENGVIGYQGDMPWRLPADLKHFKETTMGLPIIMGRLTWASLGRALPGRLNIVISSKDLDLPDGVVQVASPEAALQQVDGEHVMIIGGGQIYKAFEGEADIVHLTQVHAAPEGDTFFVFQDPDLWQEQDRQRFAADEKNSADYSFVTLVRKSGG